MRPSLLLLGDFPFLSWFVLLLSLSLKALFTVRAEGCPRRWLQEQVPVREVWGGGAGAGRTPEQLQGGPTKAPWKATALFLRTKEL